MYKNLILIALSLLLGSTTLCFAEETRIIVRVKSHDAKFVGTSMGGALVIINNSQTGELLARGLTVGGTGNTQKVMVDPIRRHQSVTDNSTAKFEAVLEIDEPVFAEIQVYTAHGNAQAGPRSTTRIWLIPGKNILGDGIIVEVTGFLVDIISPQTPASINLENDTTSVPVKAHLVLM